MAWQLWGTSSIILFAQDCFSYPGSSVLLYGLYSLTQVHIRLIAWHQACYSSDCFTKPWPLERTRLRTLEWVGTSPSEVQVHSAKTSKTHRAPSSCLVASCFWPQELFPFCSFIYLVHCKCCLRHEHLLVLFFLSLSPSLSFKPTSWDPLYHRAQLFFHVIPGQVRQSSWNQHTSKWKKKKPEFYLRKDRGALINHIFKCTLILT